MAIFLIMGKFTSQGIKNLKQTTSRAERFRDIFWLMGECDVVNIVEAHFTATVFEIILFFDTIPSQ